MDKNNLVNIGLKLVEKATKKGASDIDIILANNTDVAVAVRKGKLESIERSESIGLGIRVFDGKKQAMVSSSDISSENLDVLIDRAVQMAKSSPEDKYSSLADEKLLTTDIKNLDIFDKNIPDENTLKNQALATEEAAISVEGITNSEGAEASNSLYTVALVTSKGFAKTYETSKSTLSVSVVAGEGVKMERDYDYSFSRYFSDLESPEKIGKTAANRAKKRLNPRQPKTQNVPVVFDPRVGKNLIANFASAINGAAIARNTSFLKGCLGKQIFAKNINIINDPHIKRGIASKPFDGEAVKNKKIEFIKDGVLQEWMLDVRSANQLGLQTNGCATRGISGTPSPSSSNLYVTNGKRNVKDLLSTIKSGFYVTETIGMGVNLITGDYSQGASGFWIENGEIVYPVNELTIASNMQEMFKNLEVSNDLELKYAINCPTIFIENMMVAGS